MASIKLKGDTSGEVTISAPSVAGTTTLELPATSSTLATQNALGVRNLIINGDMRIAQRGTSKTGITTNSYSVMDRMKDVVATAGTWTTSQSTDVPSGQGFGYSYKWECTTSTSSPTALFLQHRLEGQMLQHLKKGTSSAESVTLSFWVKTNKIGTYVAELRDNDNTRLIGKSYTVDTANTWEKKTITFEGDTTGAFDNDNNASLDLSLWFAADSSTFGTGTQQTTWGATLNANRAVAQTVNLADSTSNYINITGIQLEVGTEATPFEHRPYDMELQRCQRYYWRTQSGLTNTTLFSGLCANTVQMWYSAPHPVTMRASPTLNYTGDLRGYHAAAFKDLTTIYSNRSCPTNAGIVFSTSGLTAGNGTVLYSPTGNGTIIFDAEL